MSVVLIRQHDENIYDITKKPPEVHKASPRHVSKFDSYVKKDQKAQIQGRYATMGPAEYPPPNAKNYLKKRTYKVPIKKPDVIEKYQSLKPVLPVPRTREVVKEYEERVRQRPKKNFIAKNIKYVLELRPKEPEQKLVLDCYGESKDIKRGLEPQHLKSSAFGKVPEYLKRFVKIREKDEQLQKDMVGTEKSICRYITKEEREELLAVGISGFAKALLLKF